MRILHLETELPSTLVPLNSAMLNIARYRFAILMQLVYSSESCRERPSKLRSRNRVPFEE